MISRLKRIGLILVNYNNSIYSIRAVESFLDNTIGSEFDYNIVVLDNASRQEEREILLRWKHNNSSVRIEMLENNIGYFPAINCGIEIIKSKYNDYYCIIVGNNDLVFPSGFLKNINSEADCISKHPIICPDITTMDGEHQNPHVESNISIIRQIIWDLYYLNYNLAKIILKLAQITRKYTRRTDCEQFRKEGFISQGYGACYIIGPKFWQLFDSLWAPTFLMGEEAFLEMQLMVKGYRMFYNPRIRIEHKDHATCGMVETKKMWIIAKTAHITYRKFVKFPFYGVSLKELEEAISSFQLRSREKATYSDMA